MNRKDLTQTNTEVQTKKQKGASLVEYALLVALIAVICIVAISALGQKVSTSFSSIASGVAGA
jgi:pilus assembly protein Flp/PilA